MQCADFSAEQLQEAVKNGYTLVATDEHGTLMGMLSILIRNVNRWWYHGRAAYVAVAPEFKGHGVYRCLSHTAVEMIKREGVSVQYLNTHVDNVSARLAYEKDGYRCVRFSPGSGTDYYSVEMAKWINCQEKNKIVCAVIYRLSELLVRLLYKPGKIRRF